MPQQQIISGVHTHDGSQVVVGGARDVYFAGKKESAETPERLCRKALGINEPYFDYRESLISAKGKRVPGTCEWVRHNESYRAWLNGTINLLWISGGPGKGKTMMSIFLTEDLERNRSNMEDTHIVHFFCSHQDEKCNTGIKLLESLIYQIISKRPNLVEHVPPYIRPDNKQNSTLSLEILWSVFSKLVRDPGLGTVLCVLDGLDECDKDATGILVPRIVDLLASSTTSPFETTFRLVVVSRDIRGLEKCTRIKLDPDNNESINNDIKNFIYIRARELSEIIGLNDPYQTEVESILLERAEGTFLWVGFAMHELRQKKTWTEVFEALDQLPSGLPAIYSRMLLQIPTERRHISSAILKWVTMAMRPLTLLELAAAVEIKPSSPLISVEQAIKDEIVLCGSFLAETVTRRGYSAREEIGVTLIHQSARDYLLGEHKDSNQIPEAFQVEARKTHFDLAQKCFECISQSSLQRDGLGEKDLSNSKESPLLLYAVYSWPAHAKNSSELAARLYDPAKPFFHERSILRKHWWAVFNEPLGTDYDSRVLLHQACLLEIVPWIELILAKKSWRIWAKKQVDERDFHGRTPLHIATVKGDEKLVRLLINHGAGINVKSADGCGPLDIAALIGDEKLVRLLLGTGADIRGNVLGFSVLGEEEKIVRLLIDKGANIEATDWVGMTALHVAGKARSKEMVQLLLDMGADIHVANKDGWTALHMAVVDGKKETVELLLNRGADIQATCKDRSTVLYQAVYRGDKEIVQLLLDKGADIQAVDKYEETVLQRAVYRGDREIVQLLLDKGADIQATNNHGSTVLHEGVRWATNRRADVVQLLLNKGADIHATDNCGLTVLHYAVLADRGAIGKKEIVQLLLDNGADIKATDEDGSTVLQKAVYRGDREIVQLLLDKGADIQATNNHGSTVLHEGVRWATNGRVDVVQLLLNKGADIHATDNHGSTVLHDAVRADRGAIGKKEIVQLLLDNGADIKATDEDGSTVLHQILHGYHPEHEGRELVQLLLDKGASIQGTDQNGLTALHGAVRDGNIWMVQLLLDKGADIEATDKDGLTLLHQAMQISCTSQRKKEMVQLLLDKGANIQAADGDGVTVLHKAVGSQYAKEGNIEVVQLLLHEGADILATDRNGSNVLHYAARSLAAGEGYIEVAQLLLDEGANVWAKGKDGKTAREHAKRKGSGCAPEVSND